MPRTDARNAGPSHRLERVGEAIRHAVADILQRGEIVDPVLSRQTVTVPGVRMSSDLRHATVAVMPLGGKDAEKTIVALKDHQKELRTLVARRVNLKYAPELRFVLDDSFSKSDAIEALLKSPQVARDLVHDEEPRNDDENEP